MGDCKIVLKEIFDQKFCPKKYLDKTREVTKNGLTNATFTVVTSEAYSHKKYLKKFI